MILSSFPVEQEGALSDEEIQARADKEGLEQLREKFDDLEEELEREAEEDENLPEGVERMIQGMIRLCRQMMVAAADKEAEFWSKMKQLEVRQNIESFKKDRKLYHCPQVQFYQMKSASADTAASLRDWVTAAFQTMNEVIFLPKVPIFFSCKNFLNLHRIDLPDRPERHRWLL